MTPFTLFFQHTFETIKSQLPLHNLPEAAALRQRAAATFLRKELPTNKLEAWRHKSINSMVETEYQIQLQPTPYRPVGDFFKCEIQHIDTNMFTFLNGWYVNKNAPLTTFPNGIIVGSLPAAWEQYPELVKPYLAQQNLDETDSLVALNEALFTDGLFVYIPDNLHVDKPMQLVSIVDSDQTLMVQQRNLIIVGKNSTFSFVQCDDSLRTGKSFNNNVTEISLLDGATLNYYKMENKDANSLLVNQVFVNQQTNSNFYANSTTFNAGYLRNLIHVNLLQPFAQTKLYGLYLVDKHQYVDNQVIIKHIASDCSSYQLYKGIADDEAGANFNGHIFVQPGAQRTNAFQTNKNIALTDTAHITTKPFLEIYADDVKCSHGATIGQLDEEALFYIRSRGICERNAKMLLMYAFANEVANFVEIESLRERLNDMIKRRLSGELSICDQCVLHCSQEKHFSFEIDLSNVL